MDAHDLKNKSVHRENGKKKNACMISMKLST